MVKIERIEPYDFTDWTPFFNHVSDGIAIGTVAVIVAGVVGFTINKLIKLILGRF